MGPLHETQPLLVRKGSNGRALGALVLGGVLLGCSPILVRISHIGPIATAFWRQALALLPLAVLFRTKGEGDVLPRRLGDHAVAAMPGLFLGGDLIAWHVSLHMTSVANSTLLTNMAPVFVTLASWLFLRQRVSGKFLTGLALSLAGVLVLNSAALSAGGQSHQSGDAVALCAAAFYAGYFVMLGRARSRFSTFVVMTWSTAAAAVCILPVALVFERAYLPHLLAGWLILLGLGWGVHAGGQGLIAFALAWLPATYSSLTLLIQPVVAAVLAWAVLNEPLGRAQAAGGAIIVAGILLARRTA